MSDSRIIEFKSEGLDKIIANAESLKREINTVSKLAKKLNIDPNNKAAIQQLTLQMRKLGDVTKLTDDQLDEVARSLNEINDAAKELNSNTSRINAEGIQRLKQGVKDLSKSFAEAGISAVSLGDELSDNVSSVGNSIAGVVGTFGALGAAAGLAVTAITPFIASLFEASDAEKQAEKDLEAYNKTLEEFSELIVSTLSNFNSLSEGLQESFDVRNLEQRNQFLKEYIALTVRLSDAQVKGNNAEIIKIESEIEAYKIRRNAAIENERNIRQTIKLNEDKIAAEKDALNDFAVSNKKTNEIVENNDKSRTDNAKRQADEIATRRKQRIQEVEQAENKYIEQSKANLDSQRAKLNEIAKSGSLEEIAQQQTNVLNAQKEYNDQLQSSINNIKALTRESEALKKAQEEQAKIQQKTTLEANIKADTEQLKKLSADRIEALQQIADAAQNGADDIFFQLGLGGDNNQAVSIFDEVVTRLGVSEEAIAEFKRRGAQFENELLNDTTTIDAIKAKINDNQVKLNNLNKSASDDIENSNKTVQERIKQQTKELNDSFYSVLAEANPELVKAGLLTFENSVRSIIDERNNSVGKLINSNRPKIEAFNKLFNEQIVSIVDEGFKIDDTKVNSVLSKLVNPEDVKQFDNLLSEIKRLVEVSNSNILALQTNFEIERSKLQIKFNDDYLKAYKVRIDDEIRYAILEYNEASEITTDFNNQQLKELNEYNTKRKQAGKKQTQEDINNILFAKQEVLRLLERQFDEELELEQKRLFDGLNLRRQAIEDNKELAETDRQNQLESLQLQQREAELEFSKVAKKQASQREQIAKQYDSLIDTDKATETIKEVVNLVQASQQLITNLFDILILQDEERLNLLKEQASSIDEQINETQGRLSELEDDLEGKRSGRREAVLQAIELEKQRELDLANQKILLEQKIAEEERKIRKKQQIAAITQATINGALAVTNILANTIDPTGIYKGILVALSIATTASQIALISQQKFAKGGILQGNSHQQGGIKTPYGELEGGEAVINKRSTMMFKPILSKINEAGGGVKFAEGGLLGADSMNANSQSANSVDLVGRDLLLTQNNLLNEFTNKKIYVNVTDINNVSGRRANVINSATI